MSPDHLALQWLSEQICNDICENRCLDDDACHTPKIIYSTGEPNSGNGSALLNWV